MADNTQNKKSSNSMGANTQPTWALENALKLGYRLEGISIQAKQVAEEGRHLSGLVDEKKVMYPCF